MENLKWKRIEEYPMYEISNYGEVKSYFKDRITILKNCLSKNGYLAVTLSNNSGQKVNKIHRLVAKHFVEGYDDINNVVNHKDGDRLNNVYSNLEWTTASKNQIHAYRVTKQKVPCWTGIKGNKHHSSIPVNQYSIDGIFVKRWDSMREAADGLKLQISNISQACMKGWKCGNYYWSK